MNSTLLPSPPSETPAASRPARWLRKDLLGIQELTAEEISLVLDTARQFRRVGTR
ncbi:MAG: hypothetical protein JO117_11275, partial [Verrucomicrobia bacterium]|nr:hypothetical protein [Verrucomicrobiota bacterium]